jgi:hypothetical protein
MERCGPVINTPASYSGPAILIEFFVVFLSPSWQTSGQYQASTASFQILSNSSFTYPFIRRCNL